jgi:hypothetical protein
MDTVRLVRLAYLIENSIPPKAHPDLTFNMLDFWTDLGECGTSACIAGWATAAFGEEGEDQDNLDTPRVARERLGLSMEQADKLFYPKWLSDRTNTEAAQVLRTLAETGQVLWPYRGPEWM